MLRALIVFSFALVLIASSAVRAANFNDLKRSEISSHYLSQFEKEGSTAFSKMEYSGEFEYSTWASVDAFKIKPTQGQSDEKMIRQLIRLRSDWTVEDLDTTETKLGNKDLLTNIFTNEDGLNGEKFTEEYKAAIKQYNDFVRGFAYLPNLKFFSFSLQGSYWGAWYGADGVVILDTISNEALVVESGWGEE